MKTQLNRLFAWFALGLLPVTAVVAAPAGQVTQSSGYVVVSSQQMAPKVAGSGTAVEGGQIITTGAGGKAVIKFQDGQIIALQSNSVFRVNAYEFDQAAPEKGVSFFSLVQGGLRAITGLIGERNRGGWKVATPTATAGIRGTDFMLVIQQGLYAQVQAGSISLTNEAGVAVLSAGETGLVSTGSTLGTSIPASQAPAGIFSELQAINLGAVGGAATGAGGAAGGGILGMPTSVVVGAGVVGAAAAAAAGGGAGDQTLTTTHH
jgi:hypothetical protein